MAERWQDLDFTEIPTQGRLLKYNKAILISA